MTYITVWEDFAKAAERLYSVNPHKCRFVIKYVHSQSKMVIKLTDDVTCLQYSTDQQQDLRKLEKLSASLMRQMVTKEKEGHSHGHSK